MAAYNCAQTEMKECKPNFLKDSDEFKIPNDNTSTTPGSLFITLTVMTKI